MSLAVTTRRLHSLAAVLIVLAVVFFFYPLKIAALPLAEYQQNLQRAITALDTLAQMDEDESDSDFENRLTHTIEAVRAALPEHQTVEAGSDVCDVDNAWLHKTLTGLDRMDVDARAEKINEALETLRALEARVAERQQPAQMGESKEQAKGKLESILARPEYVAGPRGPNALTRLLQDLMQWLQRFFPRPRSVDPGRLDLISLIVRIIVLGLAVLVIAYVIRILLRRFWGGPRKIKASKKREPRIVLGERLEPEATATDLLSEAELLARQGDVRAAIRKAYIALLVELGDRKLIRLAHHKTNRDYLNSIRNTPQLHSRMRALTDSFERHWYGFANATPNDWQDFRAGYLAALHVETN